MGPSGSGKTPFLNAVTGRASTYAKLSKDSEILVISTSTELRDDNTGQQTQSISIIQRHAIQDYPQEIGYVPQDQIMLSELSVYENLYYQALLRLSSDMTENQKLAIVEDVINILELDNIRNSIVGVGGQAGGGGGGGGKEVRGISGGQRARVNIGLELVAFPRILFLDEPTSGLDSTAALQVARCLAKLSDLGITTICVIHQPIYSVFHAFSHLTLLAPGGKLVYSGETQHVREYFEDFLGYRFTTGENEADWICDIVGGGDNIVQRINTGNMEAVARELKIQILQIEEGEEEEEGQNTQQQSDSISIQTQQFEQLDLAKAWELYVKMLQFEEFELVNRKTNENSEFRRSGNKYQDNNIDNPIPRESNDIYMNQHDDSEDQQQEELESDEKDNNFFPTNSQSRQTQKMKVTTISKSDSNNPISKPRYTLEVPKHTRNRGKRSTRNKFKKSQKGSESDAHHLNHIIRTNRKATMPRQLSAAATEAPGQKLRLVELGSHLATGQYGLDSIEQKYDIDFNPQGRTNLNFDGYDREPLIRSSAAMAIEELDTAGPTERLSGDIDFLQKSQNTNSIKTMNLQQPTKTSSYLQDSLHSLYIIRKFRLTLERLEQEFQIPNDQRRSRHRDPNYLVFDRVAFMLLAADLGIRAAPQGRLEAVQIQQQYQGIDFNQKSKKLMGQSTMQTMQQQIKMEEKESQDKDSAPMSIS